MLVVHMPVTVRQRLVGMQVLVPLGEVQPEPERHQRRGDEEQRRHPVVPDEQAAQRAGKPPQVSQPADAAALRLLLLGGAPENLAEYRIEHSHGRFLGV